MIVLNIQKLQKKILINQWSILRHLKDLQQKEWSQEGTDLARELSLLLLPFSQRMIPWDMDKSDKQVIEDLKKWEPPTPIIAQVVKKDGTVTSLLKNPEGDGKTPPPKEETPMAFAKGPCPMCGKEWTRPNDAAKMPCWNCK